MSLRSPALLALRGTFTREGSVALVVEFLAGGDLGALVAARRRVRAHALGLASPPRAGGNGDGDGTGADCHGDVGAHARVLSEACEDEEEPDDVPTLSPDQCAARAALRKLGWRAPRLCGAEAAGVRVRVDWAAVQAAVLREHQGLTGQHYLGDPVTAGDKDDVTPLPPAAALRAVSGACLCEVGLRAVAAGLTRALRDLHSAQRAHHDVKPQNVLLGREGEVKLGDFGLAR